MQHRTWKLGFAFVRACLWRHRWVGTKIFRRRCTIPCTDDWNVEVSSQLQSSPPTLSDAPCGVKTPETTTQNYHYLSWDGGTDVIYTGLPEVLQVTNETCKTMAYRTQFMAAQEIYPFCTPIVSSSRKMPCVYSNDMYEVLIRNMEIDGSVQKILPASFSTHLQYCTTHNTLSPLVIQTRDNHTAHFHTNSLVPCSQKPLQECRRRQSI